MRRALMWFLGVLLFAVVLPSTTAGQSTTATLTLTPTAVATIASTPTLTASPTMPPGPTTTATETTATITPTAVAAPTTATQTATATPAGKLELVVQQIVARTSSPEYSQCVPTLSKTSELGHSETPIGMPGPGAELSYALPIPTTGTLTLELASSAYYCGDLNRKYQIRRDGTTIWTYTPTLDGYRRILTVSFAADGTRVQTVGNLVTISAYGFNGTVRVGDIDLRGVSCDWRQQIEADLPYGCHPIEGSARDTGGYMSGCWDGASAVATVTWNGTHTSGGAGDQCFSYCRASYQNAAVYSAPEGVFFGDAAEAHCPGDYESHEQPCSSYSHCAPTATSTPMATAVIRSTVISGNSCVPDSDFTVRVEIADNPTGQMPIAANIRVHYPADLVDFVSLTPGQLGLVAYAPETSSTISGLPTNYRNVATFSNFANADATPIAFDVLFHTKPGFVWEPYSLIVLDDTNASRALIDNTTAEIKHTFDNGSLDPLVCVPITPTETATPTPVPTEIPDTLDLVFSRQVGYGDGGPATLTWYRDDETSPTSVVLETDPNGQERGYSLPSLTTGTLTLELYRSHRIRPEQTTFQLRRNGAPIWAYEPATVGYNRTFRVTFDGDSAAVESVGNVVTITASTRLGTARIGDLDLHTDYILGYRGCDTETSLETVLEYGCHTIECEAMATGNFMMCSNPYWARAGVSVQWSGGEVEAFAVDDCSSYCVAYDERVALYSSPEGIVIGPLAEARCPGTYGQRNRRCSSPDCYPSPRPAPTLTPSPAPSPTPPSPTTSPSPEGLSFVVKQVAGSDVPISLSFADGQSSKTVVLQNAVAGGERLYPLPVLATGTLTLSIARRYYDSSGPDQEYEIRYNGGTIWSYSPGAGFYRRSFEVLFHDGNVSVRTPTQRVSIAAWTGGQGVTLGDVYGIEPTCSGNEEVEFDLPYGCHVIDPSLSWNGSCIHQDGGSIAVYWGDKVGSGGTSNRCFYECRNTYSRGIVLCSADGVFFGAEAEAECPGEYEEESLSCNGYPQCNPTPTRYWSPTPTPEPTATVTPSPTEYPTPIKSPATTVASPTEAITPTVSPTEAATTPTLTATPSQPGTLEFVVHGIEDSSPNYRPYQFLSWNIDGRSGYREVDSPHPGMELAYRLPVTTSDTLAVHLERPPNVLTDYRARYEVRWNGVALWSYTPTLYSTYQRNLSVQFVDGQPTVHAVGNFVTLTGQGSNARVYVGGQFSGGGDCTWHLGHEMDLPYGCQSISLSAYDNGDQCWDGGGGTCTLMWNNQSTSASAWSTCFHYCSSAAQDAAVFSSPNGVFFGAEAQAQCPGDYSYRQWACSPSQCSVTPVPTLAPSPEPSPIAPTATPTSTTIATSTLTPTSTVTPSPTGGAYGPGNLVHIDASGFNGSVKVGPWEFRREETFSQCQWYQSGDYILPYGCNIIEAQLQYDWNGCYDYSGASATVSWNGRRTSGGASDNCFFYCSESSQRAVVYSSPEGVFFGAEAEAMCPGDYEDHVYRCQGSDCAPTPTTTPTLTLTPTRSPTVIPTITVTVTISPTPYPTTVTICPTPLPWTICPTPLPSPTADDTTATLVIEALLEVGRTPSPEEFQTWDGNSDGIWDAADVFVGDRKLRVLP